MATTRDGAAAEPRRRDQAGRAARAYVAVFAGGLGLLLATVVGLNVLLGHRAQGSLAITRAASEWQERTRGVTYPPPISNTRPFKSLRLHDRRSGIDGVLLGSSTAMGVTAAMFPPGMRVYNFTIAGNGTSSVVGEALHIQRRLGPSIKWLFLALDWSVGGIYLKGPAQEIDLTPRVQLAQAGLATVPVHERVLDALTLPKVRNLGTVLLRIARAPAPVAAFRQAFLAGAPAQYQCPDGTPAVDFDVVNLGKCSGYRYDGSWTYFGQDRLREAEGRPRVQAALSPASKYSQYLIAAQGEPYGPYLAAIAEVAGALRERGGHLIVLLPPLVPGLEQAFLASPRNGPYLERTRAALERWARASDIVVLDAGRSENFGCTAAEFTDEHHAAPECFAKVLGRFWRDYGASGLPSGIYRPARAEP